MIASYGIIADVDNTVTAVAPAFHCVAVEMLRHLFLGGTALNNPTEHYVDPREDIISLLKRHRSQARIPIPRASSPPVGAGGYDTTGNRAMTTKNLALAASIMMLATISGQALAGTAAPKAQYWRAATGRSDHQAVRAFNAIDPPMATQTMEPNAHRYHGGPKYND
jgi:hypothetical protein